ncbi:MAG: HlyD family secretion protein [Methylovirgula sp.]|nr:HlyD family secretion protein [Methylovirgula sp.]
MAKSRSDTDLPIAEDGSTQGAPLQAAPLPETKSAAPAKKRRPTVGIVLILLFGGLGFTAYEYWLANRDYETTDDAFIDGRAVSIAPQVSGNVVSLDVTDNEFVKKGQPLIHIDNRQYVIDVENAKANLAAAEGEYAGVQYAAEVAKKNFPAQLDSAKAQLASAQALLVRAQADYDRQKELPSRATTQQEVDAATAALRQAEAQVAQAQAQVEQATPVPQRIGQVVSQVAQFHGQIDQAKARLDQALLNLSYTVVVAPQDGWITKRNVEVGTYVTPGQQIFSLVSPEVWVTANFKESQLAKMRAGQPATISIDAYPDLKLKGHVDSVQLGTGSRFSAFPPENATGNFVKIVQRVPVKIDIDSSLDPKWPLSLGLSVDPSVKVQ